MQEDESMIIRFPAKKLKKTFLPRLLVQGIINDSLHQAAYLMSDGISQDDYIEYVSAIMLSDSDVPYAPEPEALRVVVLVDSVEQRHSMPPVIGWKVAMAVVEPYPARTIDQEKIEILETINKFSLATTAYIPAMAISVVTGLSLPDVQDHLDVLGEEGLVKT